MEESAIQPTITFKKAPKDTDRGTLRPAVCSRAGMAGFKISESCRLATRARIEDAGRSLLAKPGSGASISLRSTERCRALRSAKHRRGLCRFFHKPFAQTCTRCQGIRGGSHQSLHRRPRSELMTDEELIKANTRPSGDQGGDGSIRYLESTPDPPPPRYLRRRSWKIPIGARTRHRHGTAPAPARHQHLAPLHPPLAP